jgi:hypothetical protein
MHLEWCHAKELNVSKRKNSSSEITTGGKANKTGNQLENFVEQNLRDYGYTEFWNYKAIAFENRKSIGGRQFLRAVPIGTTIYETVRKCDFLVINNQKFPDNLIIECKWQQSSGSVDEKYPLLVFNILKTGIPTVILLDGGGYSANARKWLLDQVHEKGALIGVWSMTEFQKAVNNGFLG